MTFFGDEVDPLSSTSISLFRRPVFLFSRNNFVIPYFSFNVRGSQVSLNPLVTLFFLSDRAYDPHVLVSITGLICTTFNDPTEYLSVNFPLEIHPVAEIGVSSPLMGLSDARVAALIQLEESSWDWYLRWQWSSSTLAQ